MVEDPAPPRALPDTVSVRQTIRDRLAELLGRPDLELRDGDAAADIDGWDSLAHLRLLSALEDGYDVVFGVDEIEAPADVGELAALIVRLAGGLG